MADDPILYTNPRSRGRIARWMLEEVGCPYTVQIVEYGPPMKAPAYLAINPMGKVPALVHNGQVITECGAICAYLADAFPEAGLAPPAGARGAFYRWLFFGSGCVEPAWSAKVLGLLPPADRQSMVGYGSYDLVMDTLEQAVSGRRFIAGDRFSAADVYIGAQIGWGMQFGSIEPRPAFQAYWDGLKGREAHRRAAALDDADIPPDAT
ncbi:MAG: glutathione S-transferase family protein [Rhodospirillaceae bacterium]|nr:glutathione S-transferase family protein [Rhodospirillaceae bacterium]